MIAAWMVYAAVVGLLVTLAALAAERALLLLRRPVRGIWAGALALSLLLPVIGYRLPGRLRIPAGLVAAEGAAGPAAVRMSGRSAGTAALRWNRSGTNRGLGIVWGAGTLALAGFLLYSAGVLQGRRKEWRRETLEGMPVLLARDIGPAVVGWRKFEIVLPEWILTLAQDARRLILEHEQQHVARQDPRLLVAGFLPVLLMPWNLALWWQFRRLRRAIELDCDARVIRSGADVARYGEVLLDVGGFCSSRGLPALATFAERATDLEVRIRAMTPRPGRVRRLSVVGAATGAVLLTAAACLMPDPLGPAYGQEMQAMLQRARDAGLSGSINERLRGHAPAEIVIFYYSNTGVFLGEQSIVSVARNRESRDPVRMPSALLTAHIESVEVLKGGAVQEPGIGGVVVVTLNATGTEQFSRLGIGPKR